MNTSEIVQILAKRLKISQREAKRLLQLYIQTLAKNLRTGNSVVLRGFGTFAIKETESRKMKLPSSGEEVLIPKRKHVSFRSSQKLKDDVKTWEEPQND